jgi:hypothetical protein
MINDRQLVALAVLEGKLPADSLSWEEIEELQEAVFDAVAVKMGSSLPHNEYVLQ